VLQEQDGTETARAAGAGPRSLLPTRLPAASSAKPPAARRTRRPWAPAAPATGGPPLAGALLGDMWPPLSSAADASGASVPAYLLEGAACGAGQSAPGARRAAPAGREPSADAPAGAAHTGRAEDAAAESAGSVTEAEYDPTAQLRVRKVKKARPPMLHARTAFCIGGSAQQLCLPAVLPWHVSPCFIGMQAPAVMLSAAARAVVTGQSCRPRQGRRVRPDAHKLAEPPPDAPLGAAFRALALRLARYRAAWGDCDVPCALGAAPARAAAGAVAAVAEPRGTSALVGAAFEAAARLTAVAKACLGQGALHIA